MKLLFDAPVDFVVQLCSDWLTLRNICDLEAAMGSTVNRLRLESIYEALVLDCNHLVTNVENMERQFDWFVNRRIRVSSLRIEYRLSRSARPKVITLLKQSKKHMRDLNINENGSSLTSISVSVARYCSNITVLEVANMALCAQFFAMLGSLHFLRDLVVFQCQCKEIKIGHLSGVSCPSVKSLSFICDYSSRVQMDLLKCFPNLESYNLSSDRAELYDLPAKLESLIVEEGSSVRIINVNANLKKLEFCCDDIDDDDIAGLFTSCHHLQELNISGNWDLTDAVAAMIGDTYGQTLTKLDVSGCESMNSSAIKDMLKKCVNLNSLTLGGMYSEIAIELDSTCLIVALDSCPLLRNLTYTGRIITDEVLARIAAAPLEHLALRGVNHITDTGIKALVNGCTELKEITITDKSMSPLIKFMWKRLRPDLEFN